MYVFFFNDTATTEIYTLSLHDALPILEFALSLSVDIVALSFVRSPLDARLVHDVMDRVGVRTPVIAKLEKPEAVRSEEHTSELQSRQYIVCRLLLEKKKQQDYHPQHQS